MKYTYTLVEAAALWAGIDPVEIQKRIDANEQKQAELAHDETTNNYRKLDAEDLERWHTQDFECDVCKSSCPDWKTFITEDGYARQVLNCPNGYTNPPAKTPPEPRLIPVRREPRCRTIPASGEFSDLPEFEERLTWLREAATSHDLPVAQEKVRSSDLRAWLSCHFPTQRPTFLYPDEADLEARLEQMTKERDDLAAEVVSLRKAQTTDAPLSGKSKSSYENLIGSFLALLAVKHGYICKDDELRLALYDVFGGEGSQPHGLSEPFLDKVFAEAKRRMIAHDPYLKDAAFPRS